MTPQETHRLSPAAYRQLEKSLDSAHCNQTTTELQAGFKLGIQHTLKALRDGFVVGA